MHSYSTNRPRIVLAGVAAALALTGYAPSLAADPAGTTKAPPEKQPLNALIIHDGDAKQDAVPLGNGIFMSRGVSNAYRVITPAGDVQINTGILSQAAEQKRRFALISHNRTAYITFTEGQPDHFGGWTLFNEPGTKTIAQASFPFVTGYWSALREVMGRRSNVLWGRDTGHEGAYPVTPTLTSSFFDSDAFELGGRRFELYSTPGGETLDSLVVWMPKERTVFTGNLFGPIFGHVPNLYSVRGDKYRSVEFYLSSIQRVIDLNPELLITGHGEPVRGAAEIRAGLSKMRDAVAYLRDRTFEGMNAGVDVWTLMRTIKLPPELAIPEGHGKIPWIIRSIWEDHLGWFRMESTTELYDVPQKSIWPDLAQLGGGASELTKRAEAHLAAGEPLQALHLVDIALSTTPGYLDALNVKLAAHKLLLDRSGRENFSETRWLESQIRATEDAIEKAKAKN